MKEHLRWLPPLPESPADPSIQEVPVYKTDACSGGRPHGRTSSFVSNILFLMPCAYLYPWFARHARDAVRTDTFARNLAALPICHRALHRGKRSQRQTEAEARGPVSVIVMQLSAGSVKLQHAHPAETAGGLLVRAGAEQCVIISIQKCHQPTNKGLSMAAGTANPLLDQHHHAPRGKLNNMLPTHQQS